MTQALKFTNTGSYEVPATAETDAALTALADQYGIDFADVQAVVVNLYAQSYSEDDIIGKVEALDEVDWDGDGGYVEIATTETTDSVLEALVDEFEDYFELGWGDAIAYITYLAIENVAVMNKVAQYLEQNSGMFA